MRKPEQSPEPSIEEILASIRRIIADDGAQARPEMAVPTYPQGERRPQPPNYGDVNHGPRDDRFSGRDLPEPSEPREETEILELTEDIMLEEGPAPAEEPSSAPQYQRVESPKSEPEPSQSQTTRDDFDELGLQTVLSNVAAEVDRLASGDHAGRVQPQADETLSKQATPSPQTTQQRLVAPPPVGPSTREDLSKDTPPARSAPVLTPQRAAAPKMHSRPVWSARHLENDGAPQPPPPNTDESEGQGGAAKSENRPRPRAASGRDHWAEGVQMPVPESGPAMPFPYAPEEKTKTEAPEAEAQDEATGSDEKGRERDDDKRVVGDYLTRVFRNSPQQDKGEREPDETAKENRAQMLAKSTVADFASDKLNAPSVAGALHADERFMEKITDSLETALAEAERADDSMLDARSDAEESDELPDIPPPPDTEFLTSVSDLEDDQGQALAEGRPPSDQVVLRNAAQETQHGIFETTPDRDLGSTPVEARKPSAEKRVAHVTAPPLDSAPSQSAAIPPSADAGSPVSLPEQEELPQEALLMGEGGLPANLEESIKEMIKPLIVQWLNENLARIVEKAVREEVAERVPSELRAKMSGHR